MGESQKFQQLHDFVRVNNHYSLANMAQKWGQISYSGFQRAVKRSGLTFKKNHRYIVNQTKKKEQNL